MLNATCRSRKQSRSHGGSMGQKAKAYYGAKFCSNTDAYHDTIQVNELNNVKGYCEFKGYKFQQHWTATEARGVIENSQKSNQTVNYWHIAQYNLTKKREVSNKKETDKRQDMPIHIVPLQTRIIESKKNVSRQKLLDLPLKNCFILILSMYSLMIYVSG